MGTPLNEWAEPISTECVDGDHGSCVLANCGCECHDDDEVDVNHLPEEDWNE